jgi:hypothetical protein
MMRGQADVEIEDLSITPGKVDKNKYKIPDGLTEAKSPW